MWVFLPRLDFKKEQCQVLHEIPVGPFLPPVKVLNESFKQYWHQLSAPVTLYLLNWPPAGPWAAD